MTKNTKKLILASKSPRRQKLLREYGFVFDIVESQCQEADCVPGTLAYDIPLINAKAKAREVSEQFSDAIVIGADTVIILDNRLLGKPRDLHHAVNMLKMLSGCEHEVISSIALLRQRDNFVCCFSETTKVRFKVLNDETIAHYLDKVNVLDKAGAYALQKHGDMFIESIEGENENVIGLPRKRLIEALSSAF